MPNPYFWKAIQGQNHGQKGEENKLQEEEKTFTNAKTGVGKPDIL